MKRRNFLQSVAAALAVTPAVKAAQKAAKPTAAEKLATAPDTPVDEPPGEPDGSMYGWRWEYTGQSYWPTEFRDPNRLLHIGDVSPHLRRALRWTEWRAMNLWDVAVGWALMVDYLMQSRYPNGKKSLANTFHWDTKLHFHPDLEVPGLKDKLPTRDPRHEHVRVLLELTTQEVLAARHSSSAQAYLHDKHSGDRRWALWNLDPCVYCESPLTAAFRPKITAEPVFFRHHTKWWEDEPGDLPLPEPQKKFPLKVLVENEENHVWATQEQLDRMLASCKEAHRGDEIWVVKAPLGIDPVWGIDA